MKGKFIVVEGLDYAGKSAALEVLEKILSTNDSIVFTREPGGLDNPIAEHIRDLILHGPDRSALTEAYLFATSRAEHTSRVKELIDEGKTVICDRYIYSSLYYQGVMKGLGVETVFNLNKEALNGVEPDLVFFFTVSDEEKQRRMQKRTELNRLDKEVNKVNQDWANTAYINAITSYTSHETVVKVIDTTVITQDEAASTMLNILSDNNYV